MLSLAISGSRGSFIMLITLVILAAVSFGLLFLSWIGLECSQELSDNMIMKDEITSYRAKIKCKFYSYALVKASFISPSKALAFGTSSADEESSDFFRRASQEYELYGRSNVQFECDIKSIHRGVCPVGVEYIDMYDFLKIFRLRKKITDSAILVVCPNIVPFSDELFSIAPSEEAGISRKASFEDYSSVTDIRKYQYSDSMKRVHWKLSAKKDELLVKNYDHTNTMVTAVILDNRATPDSVQNPAALEDSLIETAVSISKFNLDDNYPVMLDYMDDESPMRIYESGSSGFDRFFFAASYVRIDAEQVSMLFDEYYNPNFLISALYVLTTNPDQEVKNFLKAMTINGLDANVIHFFERDEEHKSKDFEDTGVSYYGIRPAPQATAISKS